VQTNVTVGFGIAETLNPCSFFYKSARTFLPAHAFL
jgi:hypothetical protein